VPGALRIAVVMVSLAAAGCAGTRIDDGVFHSAKGYRVIVPGADWTVKEGGRADLELKHRDGSGGMLVNASCGRERARGPLSVLARHLLTGLRDQSVITREDVSINGAVARHAIVEGRLADSNEPVTIELYVIRDDRCIYDLLYAAPAETFEARRGDFDRLVRTLTTNGASARPRGD
jgi:hypothetical protein